MEKKRAKRSKPEDGMWDCSVCTYKNSAEAFKCAMCDVRKGTSTRKPKPNPELVAQQVAQQLLPPPKREKLAPHIRRPERPEPCGETDTSQDSHRSDTVDHNEHRKRSSTESRRLKNIDRRSGVSMEVTVGGVTVIVTDYKLKSSPSVSKSRASTDSQSSHDTVTTSSPDNQVSHSASNSVGSPVQPSENDRLDPD